MWHFGSGGCSAVRGAQSEPVRLSAGCQGARFRRGTPRDRASKPVPASEGAGVSDLRRLSGRSLSASMGVAALHPERRYPCGRGGEI